jgi:hypothetical protein
MREHESHRCMRENERHRECAQIRCGEAIDVGNNQTHHCLSLGARSVDRRRRRLEALASPPMKVTRRDSNVINNGHIVASTRNIDDNNKQTALANSSNKVKAMHASPTCSRMPLSNCTNQHGAFKLFLGGTCYSSALDAEAFVPVMVQRERAIAECDAKHLLWNLISSDSVIDTGNPTVYSDGRLQIANLPPLVQRKSFPSSRRANLNIGHATLYLND